jgi:hypothetical protein
VNLLHFKVYGISFLLAWLDEKYSKFLLLFCGAIPLGVTPLWTQNGRLLQRNPFAENQQSTIWLNFWNDLFSQRKNRTCWQRTNRDGKEVALKAKEQASKAKLAASDFKEVLSIVTKDA